MVNQLNLFENEPMSTGKSGAKFGLDKLHRFVLWRIWNDRLPIIMYIGLNPSTAKEIKNDRTISRLVKFTKEHGFGGLYMLNLFTFVTAYPKELKTCRNPAMFANRYIKQYAKKSDKIVFCWGNFKESKTRAEEVKAMFTEAYCFKKNKDGSPRHPLYVPNLIELIKYYE